MKPINSTNEGCTPISSNCVIWQGPDIPCIKLCKGDSVSAVIFALATKLCDIIDILDITTYDLSCLNLVNCAPTDFHALIQLLIQKICDLENITPSSGSGSTGCPDCVVTIAPCFQYADPTNGDIITSLNLDDYVKLIGLQVCNLLSAITSIQAFNVSIDSRVRALENKPTPTFNLPNIIPTCVLTGVPTPLDQVVVALEQQFCQLLGATGSPNALYGAIDQQPAGLNQAPALGTQGGTMGEIDGWVNDVKNLADSVTNIWLTLADIRSAITNIKLNCCATPCNGVAIKLSAAFPNPNTLVLYFTGTIPAGLVQCDNAGTLFTISDQSGNSISTVLNLPANMNNPTGFPITVSGTPLNLLDDLTISSNVCFKDDTIGTICQSVITYTLINTLICPSVTYTPQLTSIDYAFANAISGIATYKIQLYDNTGTILLQEEDFAVSGPNVITGTFNGLTAGTNYRIRVVIVSGARTTTCPFTATATLPNPCPPPQTVTATLTIP